ncbi:hypothetical protein MPDQ_001601 [Monascus purpureus]|uniref:Uncharacterized protein n=1 Tax=Monascus purpureus TaxID=5098 RepID=A0A507QRM0_MONPU|nr:hypothetical protein MPDQ_001601 [Monascus purpureus]
MSTNYLDNTVTTGSSSSGPKSDFLHPIMTEEEHNIARAAARFGYGPLAKLNPTETYLPAFGGEFQPGLYKSVESRKIANPAPLGLSAFALSVFVLSAINMQVRNIKEPNIVVGLAFAYGGLVQLAAGMWEMAIGNTFGATALSSYGGFWMSLGIILTPGGFRIHEQLTEKDPSMFANSFGLFLIGNPNTKVIKAGGFFGLFTSFIAWYNVLAGIADTSNSFFIIPVLHFPWSATGRVVRKKGKKEVA